MLRYIVCCAWTRVDGERQGVRQELSHQSIKSFLNKYATTDSKGEREKVTGRETEDADRMQTTFYTRMKAPHHIQLSNSR